MNKNMTSGEGGAVITNNKQLYRRAVACHDLGYARDDAGRLVFDDPEICVWGRGYRMDEMRAAVLRVQLSKLPSIVARMRHSKYRIRESLAAFSDRCAVRRIPMGAGDTGPFLITTYNDGATAQWVSQALRAEGIVTEPQGVSNIVMTGWGLHIYYNNASLLRRTGLAWRIAENQPLERSYEKGTCPVADSLFERSVLIAIPSCLREEDEQDVIHGFHKVLRAVRERSRLP
jgi:8-amino-3,8-dideoxy-alpha-D-manno-octulosonate transaminase